jgi:hypothetical protein
MKKLFLALALITLLAATGHASTVRSGYLHSQDEVYHKIQQLKEVIYYSYQRSGVTLYAQFFYWTFNDDESRIFYCYSLAPLGATDDNLLEIVNDVTRHRKVEPVYVPVRIDRAGRMRS